MAARVRSVAYHRHVREASRIAPSVAAAAAVLTFIGAAGCGGSWLREPPPERVLDDILPASVQVVLEQQEGRRFRSGSGVVIAARPGSPGADCFILTSGHTFAGTGRAKEIRVLFRRHEGPGVRASASLLAVSDTDQLDLALLGTSSAYCPVARLGGPAVLGESVWVVSFPWGRELTVSRGVISQLRRSGSDRVASAGRLMVDATVSYGASGGGVFRARGGELVGLVEGYPTARVAFEGAASPTHVDVPVAGQTFVTPAVDLQEFLRAHLAARPADEAPAISR
jgi:serine protease Do